MPKLTIDDRTVEVPEGTKVIEAAERAGIHIPRFCYHPALGSVGACRVCAVKFLQGPFKGIEMSCMIDASDGMVVSTTDAEAVDFRRHVIEWLMINHPHDCPVCDEGGHCILQDTTVSGGHGLRRYQGKKRTYPDQDLGPLVAHEMNRCIQCYRCARYYQEYAGYRDLGVMGIASRVYFGRFRPGTLESPFAGNLVDVCPTGVYTDRPSRYRGRRWDFERTPSVCIHCALGCRTTVDVRYREVMRIEARQSAPVNGHFICDRGRYGYYYASAPTRPRRALIGGAETRFEDACSEAVHRIGKIVEHHGAGAVAVVGSARSTLETLWAERRICKEAGWRGPVLFGSAEEHRATRLAPTLLTPELARSLEELKDADLVLVAGVDPVNEAPMLAIALRQAARNGARIEVLDPRPVGLPLEYVHRPTAASAVAGVLGRLADGGKGDSELEPLCECLGKSSRPVVVCAATGLLPEEALEEAARLAQTLQKEGKQAGLFFVMNGANTFSASRLADGPADMETLLPLVEERSIRALVVVEEDPLSSFPDLARLADALARLDLLVVLDYLDSETVRAAQVFFPTRTVFETGGTFVNNEGRIQQIQAAFSGGAPIAETGGGGHPPRVFQSGIPGDEPRRADRILGELALQPGRHEPAAAPTAKDPLEGLGDAAPELSGFDPEAAAGAAGVRATLPIQNGRPAASPEKVSAKKAANGELLLVDAVFGTEILSRSAPWLKQLESAPAIFMHPEEAARLGLARGDLCELATDAGTVAVAVETATQTAPGTFVLPRLGKIRWQVFPRLRTGLDAVRIRKAGEDS